MKLKIFFLFVTLSLFSCSQTKKEYKLNYYGGHLYFDIIFNSKKVMKTLFLTQEVQIYTLIVFITKTILF